MSNLQTYYHFKLISKTWTKSNQLFYCLPRYNLNDICKKWSSAHEPPCSKDIVQNVAGQYSELIRLTVENDIGYIYVYIYIYREREGEKERYMKYDYAKYYGTSVCNT